MGLGILIDLEKVYQPEGIAEETPEIKSFIERCVKKLICRHCESPSCVEACPQDALKREDDELKRSTFLCTSCKTCVIACPFGVNVDEIVEYKYKPPAKEIMRMLEGRDYVKEGEFEESEEITEVEKGIFVKTINWKKQIGFI